MDQKSIISALQKALSNGSGSLDDLENLLKRAQEDIQDAKAAQKEAEEKAKAARGNQIAELATRLINGETTADDAAFVLNAWTAAEGYACKFNDKDLKMIISNAEDAGKKVTHEFEDIIDTFCDALLKFGDKYGMEKPKVEKPKKSKTVDADDVIDDFLKSFGLR